jgi:hypothetical protein
MSPFQKLIQGGYSETCTRASSLPKLGGRCTIKRGNPKKAAREKDPEGETCTRASSGPPPGGSTVPTKGRLDRPFAVLGLEKLVNSSEEENAMNPK